jgi:hypothetical protein
MAARGIQDLPASTPEWSIAMAAPAEAGISPLVEGPPGFYYKAVHVEEVTPEQYVPGAGLSKSKSILPSPALIPANSPTILAAMSSLSAFNDGMEIQGLVYEQPSTAYWIDKARLDGLGAFSHE